MLTVEDTDHITNIPTHVLLEITRNLTLGDALILRSSSKQINNRVSLLSPQITQIHKYYETYKPSWRNTLKHMKSSWHFGISAKLSMAFGLIGLVNFAHNCFFCAFLGHFLQDLWIWVFSPRAFVGFVHCWIRNPRPHADKLRHRRKFSETKCHTTLYRPEFSQ